MRCRGWMLSGALLLGADAAMAALGGGKASVDTDQSRMAATAHLVTNAGDHVAHTLTSRNGSTIKEYVNAAGTVYAVSWQGPGKPDLAHLLGRYFQNFQDGGARRARMHVRVPVQMAGPDLVVQTGGHPGSFWGMAYLPSEAPAGFDPSSMQ